MDKGHQGKWGILFVAGAVAAVLGLTAVVRQPSHRPPIRIAYPRGETPPRPVQELQRIPEPPRSKSKSVRSKARD